MAKLHSGLVPFEQFGLIFSEEKKSGDHEFYTECPFSGKQGKFYVNAETGLWSSKNTGKSGNLITFCRQYFNHCLQGTTEEILKPLSISRQIPLLSFTESDEVAWNPLTGKYLIAYLSPERKILNIGHYKIGDQAIIKTAKLPLKLIGEQHLPTEKDERSLDIFILEGEWDYFIMKWLLARCGKSNSFLCGCPSAGVFSESWYPYFKGHKIFVCYDNDKAGKEGCDKLKKMLLGNGVANSMSFLHWPQQYEQGYDIRDFIRAHGGDYMNSFRTPHIKCYNMLAGMFRRLTPNEANGVTELITGKEATALNTPMDPPETVEDNDLILLDNLLNSWLKLKNMEEFDIMFGSLIANKIDSGEPIWLLLVGPPGSKKTEMIMTLNKSLLIESTSTLTPASLICGFFKAVEPSLIPRLNKRVLAVKDLTSVLSGNPAVRDEVFAILRDAYDGYVEKVFSSGKKSFKSRFGFLGGVTNTIDSYQNTLSSLGERFIKLRLDTPDNLEGEISLIDRVLGNINKENVARDNIQNIVKKILSQDLPDTLPLFSSDEDKLKIIYLGIFVARLRAGIVRNSYTNEQLVMGFHELGSRISKVFTKLAIGISIFRKKEKIDDYVIKLIKRVALDTVPDRINLIIRFIYKYQKEFDGRGPSTGTIAKALNLHGPTISKIVTDLTLLENLTRIDRTGSGNIGLDVEYRLSADLSSILDRSTIYM